MVKPVGSADPQPKSAWVFQLYSGNWSIMSKLMLGHLNEVAVAKKIEIEDWSCDAGHCITKVFTWVSGPSWTLYLFCVIKFVLKSVCYAPFLQQSAWQWAVLFIRLSCSLQQWQWVVLSIRLLCFLSTTVCMIVSIGSLQCHMSGCSVSFLQKWGHSQLPLLITCSNFILIYPNLWSFWVKREAMCSRDWELKSWNST